MTFSLSSDPSEPEILFANERFYLAFAHGDMEAMTQLWSDQPGICCLHPGWEPLFERRTILASWNAILRAPPPVSCVGPTVLSVGRDGAVVVCWEEIEGEYLIATNVFRYEEGAWFMVHHQAGPTRGTPPSDPSQDTNRAIN